MGIRSFLQGVLFWNVTGRYVPFLFLRLTSCLVGSVQLDAASAKKKNSLVASFLQSRAESLLRHALRFLLESQALSRRALISSGPRWNQAVELNLNAVVETFFSSG